MLKKTDWKQVLRGSYKILVLFVVWQSCFSAAIAFHIADVAGLQGENAVRPPSKPIQCGCFIGEWPHFDSINPTL